MGGRRGPSGRRENPSFPRLGPDERFDFPEPRGADRRGIVCQGGNLSPGMLLSAYSKGIFPWFSEDEPIFWWSPDPRFVLIPERLHVSATMRKVLRRYVVAAGMELRLDTDFAAVIGACSAGPRPRQRGTWITPDMVEAYIELHREGFAHSVELWSSGELLGGLYGVSLGSAFFGESMFSRADDASKAAFIPLVWALRDEGFTLIDSQVYTEHLAGLGATEIDREDYLRDLAKALEAPTRRGDWGTLFPDFPRSTDFGRVVLKEAPEP